MLFLPLRAYQNSDSRNLIVDITAEKAPTGEGSINQDVDEGILADRFWKFCLNFSKKRIYLLYPAVSIQRVSDGGNLPQNAILQIPSNGKDLLNWNLDKNNPVQSFVTTRWVLS